MRENMRMKPGRHLMVLEKIGKRTTWNDEEIGSLIGNTPGNTKIHVEPQDNYGKEPKPRFLIVEGRIERRLLVALWGHSNFEARFKKVEDLPFSIGDRKRRMFR